MNFITADEKRKMKGIFTSPWQRFLAFELFLSTMYFGDGRELRFFVLTVRVRVFVLFTSVICLHWASGVHIRIQMSDECGVDSPTFSLLLSQFTIRTLFESDKSHRKSLSPFFLRSSIGWIFMVKVQGPGELTEGAARWERRIHVYIVRNRLHLTNNGTKLQTQAHSVSRTHIHPVQTHVGRRPLSSMIYVTNLVRFDFDALTHGTRNKYKLRNYLLLWHSVHSKQSKFVPCPRVHPGKIPTS